MKTTQQTRESTITPDSNELIELDDLSLSQVAGGSVSLSFSQIEYKYYSRD
jgi:hypothetical protein